MADLDGVALGPWPDFENRTIAGPAGAIAVRIGGRPDGAPVLFCHSILTSSAIWIRQARLLAERGFRVLCMDMRGHGRSEPVPGPYAMDDLVADTVAVLDALAIERVRFVGVSQGGMIGFGLGVRHPRRVTSLCIVAARADAPPPFAAAWDDRIALVERDGSVDALAGPTADRWFGSGVLDARPPLRAALLACIRETSAQGFIGCARAIQKLDYRHAVAAIAAPTALVIGSNDTLLLQPMRDLAPVLPDAMLQELADAGHLPQLDQPDAFEAALLAHFDRVPAPA